VLAWLGFSLFSNGVDAMAAKSKKSDGNGNAKEKPIRRTKRTSTKIATNAPQEKLTDSSEKPTQKNSKEKIGFQLNWNRAIHIDTAIDDMLLKTLTPRILKLKQESTDPITIGIDSPGGNIAAMLSLLGLLQAPDQDGNYIEIYTVSTNKAFSAAASLLAFGDYSVAFPHSKILCHDVRYSGIEHVTPSKALRTARELERGNVEFSLKLAHKIRRRIIWVYIDLQNKFYKVRERYSQFAEKQDAEFSEVLSSIENISIDIVGFALTLFSKLSNPIGNEIAIGALHLLNSWMQIDKIERQLFIDDKVNKDSNYLIKVMNDLVIGIRNMNLGIQESDESPEPIQVDGLSESAQKDIKLFLEVIARRFAIDKYPDISHDVLDSVIEDFAFIKEIRSSQHVQAITKLILDTDTIFFGGSIKTELDNAKDDTDRGRILAPVYPQARMLWFYIVSLCRCLCSGEHLLTPYDAQLLGFVDEVLGGGPVESRREWRKSQPDYVQSEAGV
jgi:ATP-dependent protease ClpP protease subunit